MFLAHVEIRRLSPCQEHWHDGCFFEAGMQRTNATAAVLLTDQGGSLLSLLTSQEHSHPLHF